jgi:DnaJ-class molecular chaperone
MPIHYCERCKTSVDVPEGLSRQNKKEIAALRRKSQAIFQVTDFLKKELQIPLQEAAGQAKTLLLHVSRRERICHRCNTRQGESEITVCPKCKALNLNWAD